MSHKVVGNVYIINMTIDINISHWQYSIYVLNFLPVIASFCRFYRFFPLSRQKYFLPWQKPNPEPTHLKYVTVKTTFIFTGWNITYVYDMLDLVFAEVFDRARKDGCLSGDYCYVYDRNVKCWLQT